MKFLPLFTLFAALSQIVGLVLYAGAGAFETSTRSFTTYIQPSGWAFSIWGAIYTLSFIFAIYQVIPKNDNQLLRAVRLPASIAFIGSTVWLFCANTGGIWLYVSVPVLFIMAASLAYIVVQPSLPSPKHQMYSASVLLPYAAWTGIAQWLNVQALLNNQEIITNASVNLVSNVFFLGAIVAWSWYFFSKSNYSKWYGLVMVWASFAIATANIFEGSIVIAALAAALCLSTLISIKRT